MRRPAYHTYARPDRARAARSRPRAARGRAGRDFSSKLAWLESHRIGVTALKSLRRKRRRTPCLSAV